MPVRHLLPGGILKILYRLRCLRNGNVCSRACHAAAGTCHALDQAAVHFCLRLFRGAGADKHNGCTYNEIYNTVWGAEMDHKKLRTVCNIVFGLLTAVLFYLMPYIAWHTRNMIKQICLWPWYLLMVILIIVCTGTAFGMFIRWLPGNIRSLLSSLRKFK